MAISSSPSASEINVELGRLATAPFAINGAEERALAGVPSGPITFTDFIGKSATKTYDDFVAYIDSITNSTGVGGDSISTLTNNKSSIKKISSIAASGTMWGSPFGNTDDLDDINVRSSSVFNRLCQHMCETETEFNNIVANGWVIAMARSGNFTTSIRFFSFLRNGYTTAALSTSTQTFLNNIDMYWWDGTDAWKRVHNASRVNITDQL